MHFYFLFWLRPLLVCKTSNIFKSFIYFSQTIIFPCNCVKGSDVGLYIECENSNLAVLSVALRNLASLLLPIEELLLKKCKFGEYAFHFIILYTIRVIFFKHL
jgi:hypothetical protein